MTPLHPGAQHLGAGTGIGLAVVVDALHATVVPDTMRTVTQTVLGDALQKLRDADDRAAAGPQRMEATCAELLPKV